MSPTYNRPARRRIEAAVQKIERIPAALLGRPIEGAGLLGRPDWLELAGNLDAGGTADAHPLVWDESTKTYTADTDTTYTVTDTAHQCFGLLGERLLCRPIGAEDDTIWEPISTGSTTHRALLTADLVAGGTAAAVVAIGTHTATIAVHDVALAPGDQTDTGTTIPVYYLVEAGQWVNGQPGTETDLTPFELTADLAPGSSAAAVKLVWAAGAWSATGDAITVYDASHANWGHGPHGSFDATRGVAKWSATSGRYEVIFCRACAIEPATLTETLDAGGGANATILGGAVGVHIADPGIIPTLHQIANTEPVLAWFDASDATWYLLNHVEAAFPVTTVSFDSGASKIICKKTPMGVFSQRSEGNAITVIETSNSCP